MRIINEAWPPTPLLEAPPTKVYSCPSRTKSAQYLRRYVRKTRYLHIINMCIFNKAWPPAPLGEPPPTKVYSCQMWPKFVKYSRRYAWKTLLNPSFEPVIIHILKNSGNQIHSAQFQTHGHIYDKLEMDPCGIHRDIARTKLISRRRLHFFGVECIWATTICGG
jgi:hypothetical protein